MGAKNGVLNRYDKTIKLLKQLQKKEIYLMDDPSKFMNLTEYKIAWYALTFLILSECVIWIYAAKGKKEERRTRSDRGTIWLIIISWCYSLMAGAYLRSQSVPEFMRVWLLPHFCYYIGILFVIAGVIVRCTAVLTLRSAFTLHVQTTDHQHLIKTGLYHFVRNPAYSGSILSLLGVSMAYRSIPGAISVIIVCFLCYGIRIHIEEKALKQQFLKEFEQYCKETRYRLLPGIY